MRPSTRREEGAMGVRCGSTRGGTREAGPRLPGGIGRGGKGGLGAHEMAERGRRVCNRVGSHSIERRRREGQRIDKGPPSAFYRRRTA